MKRTKFDFRTIRRGGIAVGIILGGAVSIGCPPASNLVQVTAVSFRPCPTPPQPNTLQVTVHDGMPGVTAANEGIFLCPGDQILWLPGSAQTEKSFTVSFHSYENPFAQGSKLTYSQASGDSLSVPVSDPGKWEVFKYSITVNNKSYDPHIIIMGGN